MYLKTILELEEEGVVPKRRPHRRALAPERPHRQPDRRPHGAATACSSSRATATLALTDLGREHASPSCASTASPSLLLVNVIGLPL